MDPGGGCPGGAETPSPAELPTADSGAPQPAATEAPDAGAPAPLLLDGADAGSPAAPAGPPDGGSSQPTPSVPKPKARYTGPITTAGAYERGWWWDLDLEGGGGIWLEPHNPALGMGRVRVGALYMAEPWYFTVGATYQYSNLSPAAFGVQAEVMQLWTGFWAQAGAEVNIAGQVGPNFSVGYSVFGVESETWVGDGQPARTALLLKLRVPVSWLLRIGEPARLPPPP